jgi:hypothetical protein
MPRGNVMKRSTLVSMLVALVLIVGTVPVRPGLAADCEFWVAPDGDDANSRTAGAPWATLSHASGVVPDQGCVVMFAPGLYSGSQEMERRFTTTTTFKSSVPYGAIFESTSTVVDFDGVANVVLEGFEIRHSGPGSSGYVMIVDRRGDTDGWSENVVIRNNVIHDSYDNDLLKVHNGVRFATIEGNVFYNQGPSEQHLDINSVTDVVIRQNIFFNDFAASGRSNTSDTKHYIVIKDSNEEADGLLGSERVTVQGNVFSGWQGGEESLVQVGNDGNAFHEAEDVRVTDNLILGTGPDPASTVIGIAGARDVLFAHNTVSGSFPASSHAFRVTIKGDNPQNENISFHNNIWSDPTGTMGAEPSETEGDFSAGDLASVTGLVLDTNLYWNGGQALPSGDVLSPASDPNAFVGDPGLADPDRARATPVWTGSQFRGGDSTIRAAFDRIVGEFGVPSSDLIRNGDPRWSTGVDILGAARGPVPALGAAETGVSGLDTAACPAEVTAGSTFGDLAGISREAVGAVECLVYHGITEGVAPGVFDPSADVSRWQMALFLVRSLDAAGVGLPDGSDQGFVDLEGLSPEAVSAVNRLAQLDVTEGVAPGVFDPWADVSRWQMALFLARWLDAAGVSA